MNDYALKMRLFFEQKGIAHTIDENVDVITVEFPADSMSKLQPGQFFAWYNEQGAWAICNSVGVVEWITPLSTQKAETATADSPDPIKQNPRWHFTWPNIKLSWKQVAGFGLAILLLFAAFTAASSSDPADPAQPTQAITYTVSPTTTPELSLLSKAEQACGPGAKVIDIQLVNGEYTLVGSLQEIYPNETGNTTWYVAEEGNLPLGTFAWLFRGQDAKAEFDKAMLLDSSRTSTVKKCEGSDCSTLWQTVYGLGNSFKNDKLYGDGKNPAYLKNVVEATFWAMKGWVNSATMDINAGREFDRCITLQPVADMMEISKEDQEFLKSSGGKADPGSLPPSGASKSAVATATPLIITATPGMAVGFGQAAYDKYNQIVGVDSANTAFTVNDGTQCYSTINASWADFKTESPMNEVLRILGPNGFKIEENAGNYMARSFDKDGSGRSACVSITGIETNYPQGVWNISSVGKVSTLHWVESYPNNAEEIQTGVAWIYPLWKSYTEPLPTATLAPNAPTVVYIGDLGNWMSNNGLNDLTAACPPEPLSGYVYLTQVTIDFQNDALSGMRYSKSSCDEYAGLHLTTYDPGRGDIQVKLGQNLWGWPMNKPIAIMPTEIGAPTYPADGASMTLDQMLGYAQQAGKNQVDVGCTNYTNGSIPGWPSAVPVKVINMSTTWYVDFSAVAGNVSANDLCHTYNIEGTGTSFNGRPLRLQSWQPTDQWTIDNQGPWWRYNGWWLSPFK